MNQKTIKKLQDAIRELRELYYDRIENELRTTENTYKEIGWSFGVSEQTVYSIARLRGLSRMYAGGGVQSIDGSLAADTGEDGHV